MTVVEQIELNVAIAMSLFAGWRMLRWWRRQRRYQRLLAARIARMPEDVYWRAFRETAAQEALSIRRRRYDELRRLQLARARDGRDARPDLLVIDGDAS